ncbi:MAG: tetratricopeptide repeat protein [Epsilonproteobacteria bacterium]|nr:tetratricopeptide repeat protein [Campylobacterota bacterium]
MEQFDFISWVIVITFTLLLIITIGGMIGIIKFKYKDHLNKLFTLLILEIVSMGFLIYTEGKEDHSKYLRNAQLKYENALSLSEQKKYDEALQKLSEILRLQTDKTKFQIKDIFLERGNILFNRKLYMNSIAPYEVYNEIVFDDAQALARYGTALRKVHRYEEARIVYERALALEPNDYYILNGLQNCLRRQGGFLLDALRKTSAEEYFQKARMHIVSMQNIAKTSFQNKKEKTVNADIALARLNWQWERYPEAIALFEEIIKKYENHSAAYEDLAALYLEYSEKTKNNSLAEKALHLYVNAYQQTLHEQDKIFIGSGIAEATAMISSATQEQVKYAKRVAALSIAKNQTELDDPYPFYASAVLHNKFGSKNQALQYIDNAISAERKRSHNTYTFDYKRLIVYERLKEKWSLNL